MIFDRSVLEEERGKQGEMSDALVREQHHTETYIKELEQEKLRSVQLKDRTGQVIQVRQLLHSVAIIRLFWLGKLVAIDVLESPYKCPWGGDTMVHLVVVMPRTLFSRIHFGLLSYLACRLIWVKI